MTFNKKYKLYETINKHPECSSSRLSILMGWSLKKTRKYIKKLLLDGVIKSKASKIGVKLYYPVHWRDLMNYKMMNLEGKKWKRMKNNERWKYKER